MFYLYKLPRPSTQFKSEGLIFESEHSLVTYFVSPNINNSNGIGLHTHKICDDIELLLEGEIYCYKTEGNFSKHHAPLLIVNRPQVPHSIVTQKSNTNITLLSFRFPRCYTGMPIDIKSRPLLNRSLDKLKQLFITLDEHLKEGLIYQTMLSSGHKYLIKEQKKLIINGKYEEIFFLNIGDKKIILDSPQSSEILMPWSLVRSDAIKGITAHCSHNESALIVLGKNKR